MARAVRHFKNVTFNLPVVKEMYSNILKRIEWPNRPFQVMDIGCGSGRVLLEIILPSVPQHCNGIIGADKNEEMINCCKRLKTDSRVSFEMMNIEAGTLPEKFLHNFDVLFSCFVLHYVEDMRKALNNCTKLLKPGGELGFIFQYCSNPLYETYQQLFSTEDWKHYTKKFENYVPPFMSNDPLQEMRIKFKEEGLDVLWSELNHDPYVSQAENFVALFSAVDSIYFTIPKEKKKQYERDFTEALGKVLGFSTEEQDLKKIVEIHFPAIVVHAKNNI